MSELLVGDVINVYNYEKVDYTNVGVTQPYTEVMLINTVITSMPGSWFNGPCAICPIGVEFGVCSLYKVSILCKDMYY